jgi:hypothetical protein
MPSLDVPNVLDVCFSTCSEPRCLKPADAELNTIQGHHFVRDVSQVCGDL